MRKYEISIHFAHSGTIKKTEKAEDLESAIAKATAGICLAYEPNIITVISKEL